MGLSMPSIRQLSKLVAFTLLGTSSAIAINARSANDQVICPAPGPHTIPLTEYDPDTARFCHENSGETVHPGNSLNVVQPATVGQLLFTIRNNGNDVWIIDENVCFNELKYVGASCAVNSQFNIGIITTQDLEFEAAIVYGGSIGGRAITNSSSCFPGNASVPISEITDLVETSLCPLFDNASLVSKESYRFDYYIPEGDLVFEMLNICNTTVKLDNETCTIDGDRFVNGTIDNGCIRLNTWVNATRPAVPALPSNDIVERAPSCPAGSSSPYPGDVTGDVNLAIVNFCAGLSYVLEPGNVQIARDIPLNSYPDISVHFTYINVCGVPMLFQTKDCIDVLSSNVVPSYNSCEFINSQGASKTNPCERFSMLVGDI